MANKKVECPACKKSFDLEEDLEAGDTTCCPDCYADLEIVKLNPLKVVEVKDFSDDYAEDPEDEESFD